MIDSNEEHVDLLFFVSSRDQPVENGHQPMGHKEEVLIHCHEMKHQLVYHGALFIQASQKTSQESHLDGTIHHLCTSRKRLNEKIFLAPNERTPLGFCDQIRGAQDPKHNKVSFMSQTVQNALSKCYIQFWWHCFGNPVLVLKSGPAGWQRSWPV